jgi:hypothetical protein
MLLYRALADLVVILHAAFVVFVVLGGLAVLHRRWIAWVHLPAATWGIALELFGWICPLTPLENWLRRAGGGAAYSTGFVEHYLVPALYPADLTRELQIGLGVAVLALNTVVYIVVLRRRRKERATP